MWPRVWAYLGDESNLKRLAFIGGGLAAVIGALWTAFIYFHPAPDEKSKAQAGVKAECGSVAIGGDVSGATITASSTSDCPKPAK
jgi:hypothetical protein